MNSNLSLNINGNKGDVRGNIDQNEEEDPFKRRSSLVRSPPMRYRANSVPEATCKLPWEDDEDEQEREKRKRSENSPPKPIKRDRTEYGDPAEGTSEMLIELEAWKLLKAAIDKVTGTAGYIKRHVKSNDNTKVEIKKATAILARQIETLSQTCNKIQHDMKQGTLRQSKKEDCTTRSGNRCLHADRHKNAGS